MRKPFQIEILFTKMAEHLGVRYVYSGENQPHSPVSGAIAVSDLTVMPTAWIEQL